MTAAAAAIAFVVLTVAARTVYGQARDHAMHFGDELSRLAETRSSGDVARDFYQLRINDAAVQIGSASTRRTATEVLDHFEHECREHEEGMVDEMKNLDVALNGGDLRAPAGPPGQFTVRDQRGEHGFVVCFAPGRSLSGREQAERARDAARTGDLGKLGGIRYVLARRTGDTTHVVATWSAGKLDVLAMFPRTGDAPGADLPGVPRPRGARRLLTAFAEGTSYAVNVYEAPGDTGALRAGVFEDLERAGFRRVAAPDDSGVAFTRDDLDVLVSTSPTKGGKTGISYVGSTMR